MKCLAVVDTNVIVSALITKNNNSPTRQVFRAMLNGNIVPLYSKDILEEYKDVLSRKKFHLDLNIIQIVLEGIKQFGIEAVPGQSDEIFGDKDDLIFYEVVMEKQDEGAYLVTGNQKHFPNKRFIVTPAEMAEILNKN